jgi:type IV fimbrial biogenesis protein FimT
MRAAGGQESPSQGVNNHGLNVTCCNKLYIIQCNHLSPKSPRLSDRYNSLQYSCILKIEMNKHMRNTAATVLSRGCRGFSALELMVVLALITIFTALALPSFNGTVKRYRVDAAASNIANVLQFARSEAIRRGSPVSVIGVACAAPSQDCSVHVQDTNGTTLKTIPADNFKGLNMQFPEVNIVYSPLGFFQGDNINSENTISLWPAGSDSAQTSPYTNRICLGLGGRVRVIASSATC